MAAPTKGPAVLPTTGTLFGISLEDVKRIDAETGMPIVVPRAIAYVRAEGMCMWKHACSSSML